MAIHPHRGGWKVVVYVGLDPVTGRQRRITRQVAGGKRQAERVEAKLRAEVAEGRHRGTGARTLGELLDVWYEWRTTNGKPLSRPCATTTRASSPPSSSLRLASSGPPTRQAPGTP